MDAAGRELGTLNKKLKMKKKISLTQFRTFSTVCTTNMFNRVCEDLSTLSILSFRMSGDDYVDICLSR
jgi:hypothetical protein